MGRSRGVKNCKLPIRHPCSSESRDRLISEVAAGGGRVHRYCVGARCSRSAAKSCDGAARLTDALVYGSSIPATGQEVPSSAG